ncbi:MAG: guanylate kinase [Clostridiales bacterium]|nr:guanylate kinase [Clostridiales bacterium]
MNNKKHEGFLVILSGPSGSGKDTILTELEKRNFDIQVSISNTTRKARDWEINGFHYNFVSPEEFESGINSGYFLEYAKYGSNYYGTPRGPINTWIQEGKIVFLKIDVQGARRIRAEYPGVVSIFLMPPTFGALRDRLHNRESEDEADIASRLEIAANEIECSKDYDYIVVNDVVNYAVSDICAILQAEQLRAERMARTVEDIINIK